MRKNYFLLSLLLALVWCFCLSTAGAAESPAFNLNAKLVSDPKVKLGKLKNGITYYIRANKKPEKRAELRLVVNAGSILERDDEQGLAHFLEHMAFNGTTHFPGQQLINYLESIGMRVGPEVNAYTGFDQTVYMLELPTDNMQDLDKALTIIADWANGIILEDKDIDKERGIIFEEWRSGRGASARIRDQQYPVIFQGSLYGKRLPMGKMDVIKSSPHQKLRDFYKRWYRPDLMAVMAVGDFDKNIIEEKIRQHLENIPVTPDPTRREAARVPDHKETLFALATDPEATGTNVSIIFKRDPENVVTVSDFREKLVEHLYSMLINQRLYEVTKQPQPPFLHGYCSKSRFVREKDCYIVGAAVKDNGILPGLEALMTEIARVRKYGFAQSELERQKKELLRSLEQTCQEQNKTESSDFISQLVSNFVHGDPIASADHKLDIAREYLPGITLNELNQLPGKFITESNRVITVSAPKKANITLPTQGEFLKILAEVKNETVTPYDDKVPNQPLLRQNPKSGRVTDEKTIKSIGVTEWTLSNGVRVVLKPTDFQNSEILLGSFSPGGNSLADQPDYPSALFATSVISESGLNTFSKIELEKLLAGKLVNVSPWIGELDEGLSGQCSPQDMETMFQLVYLYFTAPRTDNAAFDSLRNRLSEILKNRNTSPETAFRDELQLTLGQNHYRSQPLTEEFLKKVDMLRAFSIYRDRFADAGDFTFVLVGNFDIQNIRPLIEQYLGGLPVGGRIESWKDTGVRHPRGIVKKQVTRGLEPKSLVQICFIGPFEWTQPNRYHLKSLADLFRIKMRECLRVDKGECYGVGISSSYSRHPIPEYMFNISFACAPEKVDEITQLIFEQISLLKTAPTDADYVSKIKEMQLRQMETEMKENNFWLDTLTWYYNFKENPEDILKYKGRIQALSTQDLQNAARKYLDNENYVRVALYPESQDGKGKESLGAGPT